MQCKFACTCTFCTVILQGIHSPYTISTVCVYMCVCVCVRACVRACVNVCIAITPSTPNIGGYGIALLVG